MTQVVLHYAHIFEIFMFDFHMYCIYSEWLYECVYSTMYCLESGKGEQLTGNLFCVYYRTVIQSESLQLPIQKSFGWELPVQIPFPGVSPPFQIPQLQTQPQVSVLAAWGVRESILLAEFVSLV